MPVLVNLRHLEKRSLQLEGTLTGEELELDKVDELIRVSEPVTYRFEVQKSTDNLLLIGHLAISLHCECSRCLKPFVLPLQWEDWTAYVPLEGEDKVAVDNDSVDLTPYIREDIVLAFPQHPLCEPNCQGLNAALETGQAPKPGSEADSPSDASPWAELDKLKFKR
jgi:uncharacterized protein